MFWVLFLLVSWAGALFACGRLLIAAGAAAEPAPRATVRHHGELSLYEAAYLAGGPQRVAVLALLSMARQGRLLLAHTGWATVVDPVGRDPLERSLLGTFGPDGQCPVASVRTAAAGCPPVRELAERLGAAGLAVPDAVRTGYEEGVRAVWAATVLILVLSAVALSQLSGAGADPTLVACWFALPLLLTVSCLAISRFEARPHSPWASPAGQRLLVGLDRDRRQDPAEGELGLLTAVAVRGPSAVPDPGLRAALSCGRGKRLVHRGR
ncbi:TIGR04222 domain-containing membrane protein [Streptomyces bambusae]|uniref:TIGR04222 domain-containing membrane protein n=1 Tax=Streptomyces bambusae TaxID=1550616 RepID=UPI001CFE3C17|nr:TIGR04222 domain-containing membrane protein [Streptomyces bambusae]MCB5165563.1 TIGR04222 domain-containing membrane protein [Streptomyces bambusae]